MMLRHACEWRFLRSNPADRIKKVKQEHKEMDCLRPNEIQLLIQHAEEPYRTLFLTAVLTGMRRGELLGFQWGDIDWNSNVIFVQRSLYWNTKSDLATNTDSRSKRWAFSSPKSRRSVRSIMMTPKLREALQTHKINCHANEYDLVFCTSNGTPLDPDNMVKQQFHPTLSRAGLRRIPFHSLRHSFTALLIAQGEHPKFIQSQLGHASIQTTMDLYGHLFPQEHHQVGSKLDGQIFQPQQTDTPSNTLIVA